MWPDIPIWGFWTVNVFTYRRVLKKAHPGVIPYRLNNHTCFCAVPFDMEACPRNRVRENSISHFDVLFHACLRTPLVGQLRSFLARPEIGSTLSIMPKFRVDRPKFFWVTGDLSSGFLIGKAYSFYPFGLRYGAAMWCVIAMLNTTGGHHHWNY